MKLNQLLEVIGSHKQVAIYEGVKEIKKSVYQIKWHHKDLLEKEIHSVVAEEDVVCVILKTLKEKEAEVIINDKERDALGVPYLEPIAIERGE